MSDELDDLPVLKKSAKGTYEKVYTGDDELPVLKKNENISVGQEKPSPSVSAYGLEAPSISNQTKSDISLQNASIVQSKIRDLLKNNDSPKVKDAITKTLASKGYNPLEIKKYADDISVAKKTLAAVIPAINNDKPYIREEGGAPQQDPMTSFVQPKERFVPSAYANNDANNQSEKDFNDEQRAKELISQNKLHQNTYIAGKALNILGDHDKAIDMFNASLANAPQQDSGQRMPNNAGDARDVQTQFPEADDQSNSLVGIAEAQIGKGDIKAGEDAFTEALKINPSNTKALVGLQQVYQAQGRVVEAGNLNKQVNNAISSDEGAQEFANQIQAEAKDLTEKQRQSDEMKNIAQGMEDFVRGKGEMGWMNPLGAFVTGIQEGGLTVADAMKDYATSKTGAERDSATLKFLEGATSTAFASIPAVTEFNTMMGAAKMTINSIAEPQLAETLNQIVDSPFAMASTIGNIVGYKPDDKSDATKLMHLTDVLLSFPIMGAGHKLMNGEKVNVFNIAQSIKDKKANKENEFYQEAWKNLSAINIHDLIKQAEKKGYTDLANDLRQVSAGDLATKDRMDIATKKANELHDIVTSEDFSSRTPEAQKVLFDEYKGAIKEMHTIGNENLENEISDLQNTHQRADLEERIAQNEEELKKETNPFAKTALQRVVVGLKEELKSFTDKTETPKIEITEKPEPRADDIVINLPNNQTAKQVLDDIQSTHEIPAEDLDAVGTMVAGGMSKEKAIKHFDLKPKVETPEVKNEDALKDVESTAKALEEIAKSGVDIKIPYKGKFADGKEFTVDLSKPQEYTDFSGTKRSGFKGLANSTVPYESVAEAYHKAKADGSNPELVKAVESILSKEQKIEPIEVVNKGNNIVLNEGSGVVINELFNKWDKLKDEKGHADWEKEIKNTKFGTYGNVSFLELLDKFEPKFRSDIIKNDFYKSIEAALGVPKEKRRSSDYKVESPNKGAEEGKQEVSKSSKATKEGTHNLTKNYNNLSAKEKKSVEGKALLQKIQGNAKDLGYSLKSRAKGNFTLVDEKGKEVRNVSAPRSKDAIQREKRQKEVEQKARKTQPHTIEHAIAQDLANGVKFVPQSLVDNGRTPMSEIPFWVKDNKGYALDAYREHLNEVLGYEHPAINESDGLSNIMDIIDDYMSNEGKSQAKKDMMEHYEREINSGYTEAELRQMFPDNEPSEFDEVLHSIDGMSDAEVEKLWEETQKSENEEQTNQILKSNENTRKTETISSDNVEGQGVGEKERQEIQSRFDDKEAEYNKAVADYNRAKAQLDKNSDTQVNMFGGAKDQSLFESDLSEQSKEVQSRKEKADKLKGELDKIQLELDDNLKGQTKLELPIVAEEGVSANKEKIKLDNVTENSATITDPLDKSKKLKVIVQKSPKEEGVINVWVQKVMGDLSGKELRESDSNAIVSATFYKAKSGNWQARWVGHDKYADKNYQRKGLATAIYDLMDRLGNQTEPATKEETHFTQSDDGAKFWENRKKQKELSANKEAIKKFTNSLKAAFHSLIDAMKRKVKVEIIDDAEAKKILEGGEDVKFHIDGKEVQGRTMPEIVNGFYSPLEKVIGETKFDKLPSKQWIDKFAKGEEAKWTGLADWLKEQNRTVSKAEIQQYLKDNRIQVVEVVNDDKRGLSRAQVIELNQINKEMDELEDQRTKIARDNYEKSVDSRNDEGYIKVENRLNELLPRWRNLQDKDREDTKPTKFSQYQTEGKRSNYKEVLITMPTDRSKIAQRRSELASIDRDRPLTESESKEYSELQTKWGKDTESFKSTHFDEPNILAHLRMNTRIDADGKKTLFIEELQSDWGQKGKQIGFSDKETAKRIDNEITQLGIDKAKFVLGSEHNKFHNEVIQPLAKKLYGKDYYNLDHNEKMEVDFQVYSKDKPLHEKLKNAENEFNKKIQDFDKKQTELEHERNDLNNSVKPPKAPFVQTTPSWVKLGLKTALQHAINEGAERISWTTGEQQNARYDLSKSVHKIEYREGEERLYAYDHYGKEILDESKVTKEKLADYIGKDAAERILKQPYSDEYTSAVKILEGNDLKVGGKGMIGFYGSPAEGKLGIVGQVAESLVGKGKVKETNIETAKNNEYTLGEGNYVDGIGVYDGKGDMVAEFDTKKDADKYIAEKSNQTQHSIDITPEMKSKVVTEGQPLFMKNAKGEVLGFTQKQSDGSYKVYIDHSKVTPETPIHEIAGHIFMPILKEAYPEIYQRGAKLVAGTKYEARAKELGLKGEDAIEEALAQAIGEKGKFLNENRKAQFIDWLKQFWFKTKEALQLKISGQDLSKMDLEQFTDLIAGSVLHGKELAKIKEIKEAPKEEKPLTGIDKAKKEVNDAFDHLIDLATGGKKDDNVKLGFGTPELLNALRKAVIKALEIAEGTKKAYDKAQVIAKAITDYFKENPTDKETEDKIKSHFGIEGEGGEKKEFAKGTIETSDEVAKKLGIDEYVPNPETIKGWVAEADKRIAENKNIFPETIERLKADGKADQIDNIVLNKYLAALDAEIRKNPTQELIDRYKEAKDVKDIKIARSAGKTLRASQVEAPIENAFGDMLLAKMEAAGVDTLTEQQIADVQKRYDELEKTKEDADKRVAELEKIVNEYETNKRFRNIVDEANKKRRGFTKQRLDAEFDELAGALSDLRKNTPPKTYSSIIPLPTIDTKAVEIIGKMVRNRVEKGIVSLADVVDSIYEKIKDSGLNKEDIRNIIGGEYRAKKQTRTELQKDLRDLRDEAKLIKKLEDLKNGVEPPTEKARVQRNQRIKELQDKIRQFKRDNINVEKELDAIKKRNEVARQKIEKKINDKDFAPITKKKSLFDDDVVKQKFPNQRRAALDALKAKEDAKHQWEIDKERDRLERRNKAQKAFDTSKRIISTLRAIKAGIDDSFTFIQGGLAIMSNPKAGGKAWMEHVKDAGSEKRFERELTALHNSPLWGIIQESKLDILEPKSLKEKEREGILDYNLLNEKFKIKGKEYDIGKYTTRPFERAFTSMGNNLRLNLFLRQVEPLMEQGITVDTHPELYKSIARTVNEMTGRGKQQKYADNALVNSVIWSPRLISSGFNILGLGDLINIHKPEGGFYKQAYKADPIRIENGRLVGGKGIKFASTQVARGIGVGASLMMLAALGGAQVTTDPTDVEFGNVKFSEDGNSYNVFGRFTTIVRLIAMSIMSEKKINGGTLQTNAMDETLRFLRGKLTPFAGTAVDVAKGKTYMGQETTLKTEINNMLAPMSLSDIYTGLQEQGAISLITRGLPAFEGVKVTNDQDFNSYSNIPRLPKLPSLPKLPHR